MATTTNYGWTTPDDTALVKDGASAIRTLGSSVDTTTKNLNPETTLGDISFRSSTSNVNTRLGIGSTNQVLIVSGGVPAWGSAPASAPANATATVNTSQGTSSSSYTDLATAGPAVTVTTGTKALVIITCDIESGSGTAAYVGFAVSGATTIAGTDLDASYSTVGTTRYAFHSVPTLTAGSNTFTVQYRSESGTKNFARRTIFVMNLG